MSWTLGKVNWGSLDNIWVMLSSHYGTWWVKQTPEAKPCTVHDKFAMESEGAAWYCWNAARVIQLMSCILFYLYPLPLPHKRIDCWCGLHKLWEPCQCPWLNKLGPRRGHSLQLYAGFSHSDCWWHLDEVPTTGTQTASQTPRCFYRRMRIHQHHWSASAEHYIIIWKPKKVMCPTIYKQRTI
jgi:hypothetical protein